MWTETQISTFGLRFCGVFELEESDSQCAWLAAMFWAGWPAADIPYHVSHALLNDVRDHPESEC